MFLFPSFPLYYFSTIVLYVSCGFNQFCAVLPVYVSRFYFSHIRVGSHQPSVILEEDHGIREIVW
jgi:hypothetical protein